MTQIALMKQLTLSTLQVLELQKNHGLQKEKQEYGHDDTPATDGQNTKKLNSDLYLSYASLLLGSWKEVEEAIGVRPLFSKNGDVSKKQDSCQLRKFRHVR